MAKNDKVKRSGFNDEIKQGDFAEEEVSLYTDTVPRWVHEARLAALNTSISPRTFPPTDKVPIIPRGRVYKLLEFMWNRNTASHADVIAHVFESEPEPQSLRSLLNKANNTLRKIGESWTLHTDGIAHVITKKNRKNP